MVNQILKDLIRNTMEVYEVTCS